MKIVARVLILAALVFGSACAKFDWIERTRPGHIVTGEVLLQPGPGE